MIIEKSDYGHHSMRLSLERYHRNITVVERILFDATSNQFRGNLATILEKSPSHIVLIWASESGSTSITRHAVDRGLIPGEHIWLTTNTVKFNTIQLFFID